MTDNVVVCLSHGFHVRNILYSPLCEQLASTSNVTVVLPGGAFVPDADRHLLRGARVVSMPITLHPLESLFLFLRKNVFAGRERTQTFNLISEQERGKHPIAYMLANFANIVFGRLPLVGRLWQKIEACIIRGAEFDALLRELRPKFVITANYGTESLEIRLLRAARRHRIPTLAIIPSWDNLSSKGVIGENPRFLAVWNDIMRQEAKSLYGFQDATVHVCGGLQFDLYARPYPPQHRDAVFARLGIDPLKPIVVIGTITPRYFANNIDIVDIVNEAVIAGRLSKDLQIVIRLHPQVIDDPVFGDDLGRYMELAAAHSRIKLSIPRVLHWGTLRPPPPEDGAELMYLLQAAAVAIMPASTLAIDACALGAPVVGVGFDGYQHKPYQQSVRRTFDFTHYRRIVALGGLRIAESPGQLIDEVAAYLGDRRRDLEGREKVVTSHLGSVDGAAWTRIMQVLNRMSGQLSTDSAR